MHHTLSHLVLGGNQQFGDDGMVALAPALPLGLRRLAVNDLGLADTGLAALAAVLPLMESLQELDCGCDLRSI